MSQERYIERAIVRALEALGVLTVKQRPPGHPGYPDRLVVFAPMRHFWMEVKQEDGRLSKVQERRIEQLRARGEFVAVSRSVADATEALERAVRLAALSTACGGEDGCDEAASGTRPGGDGQDDHYPDGT